jgi:hypothetical protein
VQELWTDKDGDGNAWEAKRSKQGVEYSMDSDEVNLDALPSEEQIAADTARYQAAHNGEKPDHLWYVFTDCTGKSVVFCYDIEHKCWGMLKDTTWDPTDQDALAGPVIDTKEELDAYLTKERLQARH